MLKYFGRGSLYQNIQNNQQSIILSPLDSTNLVHFTSVATLPSKGSVKLVSSVLSLNDAVSKGLGFLYQISKHNQHRETKLQVPHYLLLVSSPPAQSPEFCILVTGKCGIVKRTNIVCILESAAKICF